MESWKFRDFLVLSFPRSAWNAVLDLHPEECILAMAGFIQDAR
jgi:hypothetical protein